MAYTMLMAAVFGLEYWTSVFVPRSLVDDFVQNRSGDVEKKSGRGEG